MIPATDSGLLFFAPMNAPANKAMWKTCTVCQLPKDLSEFHHGANTCTPCENARRAMKRPSLAVKRAKGEIVGMINQLTNGKAEVYTTAMLANGLIAELGGLQTFLTLTADTIHDILENKSASAKARLDALNFVTKLVIAADEKRNATLDENMSDEELDDLIYGILAKRAESKGLDALDAMAQARGMRLVPMDPTEIDTIPITNAAG